MGIKFEGKFSASFMSVQPSLELRPHSKEGGSGEHSTTFL